MKKIRNKVLIILVLVTLLPVLLIGGYSLYSSSQVLRENVLSGHINNINLLQERINNLVSGIDSDILYLRDSNALHLYLSSTTEGSHTQQLLLRNLRSSFKKFSKQQKIYQQVRFLDTQGKELIRIDRNNNVSTSIADVHLQSRADEEYFIKGIVLKEGELYISPFVLSHPKQNNDDLLQPTIRYATPVFDRKNTLRGTIVLDIDGNAIKDLAKKQDANQQLYIIDNQGHYIYHHDSTKEWGEKNKKTSFINDMPNLKKYLGKKSTDSYIESNGNIIVYQPISLNKQQNIIGTIFSIEDKATVFKPLKTNLLVYLAIFLVSLILSWLLAIVLTNSIVKPLVTLKQQVKSFSMGEIDTEIKASTDDEVGELAHAIELLRKSMQILIKRSL